MGFGRPEREVQNGEPFQVSLKCHIDPAISLTSVRDAFVVGCHRNRFRLFSLKKKSGSKPAYWHACSCATLPIRICQVQRPGGADASVQAEED